MCGDWGVDEVEVGMEIEVVGRGTKGEVDAAGEEVEECRSCGWWRKRRWRGSRCRGGGVYVLGRGGGDWHGSSPRRGQARKRGGFMLRHLKNSRDALLYT